MCSIILILPEYNYPKIAWTIVSVSAVSLICMILPAKTKLFIAAKKVQ